MNPQEFDYCPECGTETSVVRREGEEQDFCPECEDVIWSNTVPWAGVSLVADSGEILLVKRGNHPDKGLWGPPAGFLIPGEHPREAAARELKEETDLDVDGSQLKIAECVTNKYIDDTEALGIIYCGELEMASGDPVAGDDAEEVSLEYPKEKNVTSVCSKLDLELHRKLV